MNDTPLWSPDPARVRATQIDVLRRFGFKVFYGDASRYDLLEAAGARDAKIMIITVDAREKINEIAETVRKHFPHLRIFARAFDRVHAYELLNDGIADVYREVFGSSLDMAQDQGEFRRLAGLTT